MADSANARVRVSVQGCYRGVGATSVVRRLVHDTFTGTHEATLGICNESLTTSADDAGVSLTFLFADCSSDPAHADATRPHVDGAHIIVLVVSCIRADGDAAAAFIAATKRRNPHTPIVLVATHSDILPSDGDVFKEIIHYNALEKEQLMCVVGELPIPLSLRSPSSRAALLTPLQDIAKTLDQYASAFEFASSVDYSDPTALVRPAFKHGKELPSCVRNWKKAEA